MTNGDKIRAMSDEELAEKIVNTKEAPAYSVPFCGNSNRCDDILDSGETVPDEMCKQCAIEWLQAECEEKRFTFKSLLEAREKQYAIMKETITKASEELAKNINYPRVIISCSQFFPDLQRIQDELMGISEDDET